MLAGASLPAAGAGPGALTSAGAARAALAAAVEPAAARTVTLVGSLQSELGCPGDWQPDCTATVLAPTDAAGVYAADLVVPAGSWEYKVALDGAWDEAYGRDGGDANVPLTVAGSTPVRFTYDDTTHRIAVTPLDLAGAYGADDASLVAPPVRQPGSDERFYFVMTDRFANGDAANDTGGLTGDRGTTGFDPTDRGFYQGGDLRGLIDRLDYVEGLGTTAIWLTPSFANRPVQGTGADASAGYHGYWVTDFTRIDPHLGTNEELAELIDGAHARGIKVYFDIITNHTADVISYEGDDYSYVDIADRPWTDAAGAPVDVAALAGSDAFPALDPATSFPRTPVRGPDAPTLVPDWLNDPTVYHNRGNTTWEGESVTYGDFDGLDDLMTEDPRVVDGFVDVYSTWVDLGIDGFRIDTVKHVNREFWEEWSAGVMDHARSIGNDDFFMFGEVYDADPALLAPYVRETEMSSVLDFTFQAATSAFAAGGPATQLQRLFAGDDRYTTPDSSATALPTFLGNHDMGRIGAFVRTAQAPLERSELAHSLMYLTRGQPVVYYGDEQGFVGLGADGSINDKSARQSLFATQVGEYADQALLTGKVAGSVDRYDTDAPLYEHIAALAALREAHPALGQGAQVELLAEGSTYAFARVDRDEKVEHLVAANSGDAAAEVTVTTLTPGATYEPLLGTDASVTADDAGAVTLTVPARGVVLLVADREVAATADPTLTVTVPSAGAAVTDLAPVQADVADHRWAETSFAWRVVGDDAWTPLGTAEDDEPRVYTDVRDLAEGTLVEYRAVSVDAAGTRTAASTFASVGVAVDGVVDDGGSGEVPLYDAVSVPGSHNSEMGCAADWQPACAQAQLTAREDGVWEGTFELPAGDYEFKAAVDGAWDVNFGAGGALNGPNVPYTHRGGSVSMYFDPATKDLFTTAMHPVYTLAGSLQSELGCPADWSPDCLATMLTDADDDGLFTYTTDALPGGSYEVKVTHGMSWDVNYGAGGAPGGGNIPVEVADGDAVTLTYDPVTHLLTVGGATEGVAGLGQAAAQWLAQDVLVVPGDFPAGTYALWGAASGGLVVEDGAVTVPEGATELALEPDPAGLPADLAEAFPHLVDATVLRVRTADGTGPDEATVASLLQGQLLVVGSGADDALVAATGVQIPGVVDDLYADAAADAVLGASWQGNRPTLRLWAPTATDVDVLLWPAARKGAQPDLTADPQRVGMTRAADGTWSVRGQSSWKGAAYRYAVTVFVPSTGQVEVNEVTDPASVALTVNSTHSVLVDLADKAFRPKAWEKAAQPVVAPVDQTIYELHVRDFSISDTTVPAELRGTYGAFAAEGTAGREHLRALADAGLTTVHLLPTFDIATIEEDRAAQDVPACDLGSYAPDSERQQECIEPVRPGDGYNWGYDPLHWSAPEGSYARDPFGGARVAEFRTMVGALHADGLQVVLDQVFNHTSASGQDARSVLDRVVPGYYHRLSATGAVETSTCCQNIATEHAMAEKMMVDSVVTWARDYKVDGFRFDLMGHHSRASMLAVRAALDALTVAEDGVDGSAVYLYGEGWNFGEVADDALFEQARQGNLGGTGIGTFSDRLRDAVRGGGPFDEDPRRQGFGSGLATDDNGVAVNGTPEEQAARLAHETDLVRLGMAGNLRDYAFLTSEGVVQRGDELDYNGQPAGYADSPEEVVTYVDAHDNETLWDALTYKLPAGTPMADRVRMNTVSLATTALAQTPSFWHAGTDLLRSKSLDRDSYDSGDWFNVLDWTGEDNGFGRGLPPAGPNEAKWPYMRPLLADASLQPTAADVATATAAAQDLLRLRTSTPLFRLGDAGLIREKLTFPGSGPDALPGVVAMHVDDTVGTDVDPELDGVLTVLNASPEPVSVPVAALAGRQYRLSDVQQQGSDAVVRGTTWDAATGTVTVPARTVAVLVEDAAPAEHTLVYVYRKLDAGLPPMWSNSGRQTLVAAVEGHQRVRVTAEQLPAGVCGRGWAVQEDWTVGLQGDPPAVIDRATGEGLLGPVLQRAWHRDLSRDVAVPACEA
ncbi:pullulanase-type alpha-1,6-glucosidase [Cellulomonas marina]|uniref:Alpha-1,6-glucosidases, pullulanase-type n=1 Tax=Cellulomonas marina TaxID=988821 RepID=A0A1I0YGY9_9CELL|nr:pullulanase-type alpha-1,6-glucosidase [Cellulomonas marina]SFB12127.1 alpha-1,6-glucosidases, pullulanase-type [Cellulomonas marina]